MKFILRTLASRLAGRHIPDLNSGMRAYHRDLALRYAYLYPSGHSIMSTMTLAFIADGLQVNFRDDRLSRATGQIELSPHPRYLSVFRDDTSDSVVFRSDANPHPDLAGLFAALATVFSIRNLWEFGSLGAVPGVLWIADLLLFGTGAAIGPVFSTVSPARISGLDATISA